MDSRASSSPAGQLELQAPALGARRQRVVGVELRPARPALALTRE